MLALSLLANVLLAVWLWRALPPAPAPLPTAVREAVVLRTPGGRLEASELRQTESFEVTRDHDVLSVPMAAPTRACACPRTTATTWIWRPNGGCACCPMAACA